MSKVDVVVECGHCGERFFITGDGIFFDCPSCDRLFNRRKIDPVFLSGMIQEVMRESLRQKQAESAA